MKAPQCHRLDGNTGLTQKQLVERILAEAAVEVAPIDAEDRPPPRRRGGAGRRDRRD